MAERQIWGADLKQQKIINLADGAAATDAVTYQQLQAAIRGLDVKEPVRATTSTNLTLTGPQTVDGVSLVAGDRILVKNQTVASGNGVYVVAAGAWARASDADTDAKVTQGLSVAVLEGTNKGTGSAVANPVQYVLTTPDPIVLGTTSLSFAIVGSGGGGASYTAGAGISIVGGVIAVDATFQEAKRYAAALGAASAGSTITITHNLGTKDLVWQIVEVSSGRVQDVDFTAATINTITGSFPAVVSAGQYRITIVG